MGPAGHGAREKIERPYSNGSLFREIARRIWAPPPPPPFLFIRQHVGLTIYAVILMTVFSACASTTTPSSPSPGSPPAAWASGLGARRSTHQWRQGGVAAREGGCLHGSLSICHSAKCRCSSSPPPSGPPPFLTRQHRFRVVLQDHIERIEGHVADHVEPYMTTCSLRP